MIAKNANSVLCRAEGLQNQYRAARLMHLQAEASVLEAEAATWTLLLHMYARTNKTYPGGRGGQQTSVPTVCLALAALLNIVPRHRALTHMQQGFACMYSSCWVRFVPHN